MRSVWKVLALKALALVVVVAPSASALQDLQLASAGPRFLSTPAPGAPAVDVSDAPALQRQVTFEVDRITLEVALDRIERQTGLHIFASPQLVPLDSRVSLHADGISVGAALFELLRGTGLDVQLARDGRTVSLVPRAGTAVRARQQGAARVEGRVTDAVTRAPLDQVAVRLEGPGLGGVTTSDGRYAIRNVPPGAYHVTARRVGYTPLTKAVTVTPDSTTGVDFALTAAATKLNEVVTTVVGNQRRYEIGNVISTINADSIVPTAPITSLTDLISARASGVTVQETGGLAGSGEAIRIRGQSSLVLQGDPIVIVDGVRQDNAAGGTAALPVVGYGSAAFVPSPSRLNDVDFADVTSIDVLKGPAASTEYGTDAANGVIVITTKHGAAGRAQWQASAEGTTSAIPERFPSLFYSWGHTLDASQTPVQCPLVPYVFGSGYGSATGTCGVDSVTTWNPLNGGPRYSIFGTGTRQKYGLSVSGGSNVVRYFVSGGLSNETGILRMPGIFMPEADALGLPRSVLTPNGEDQRSVRANTAIHVGPTADLTVTGAYLSTYQKTPNAAALYQGIAYTAPVRDSAHGYGYNGVGFYQPLYQFGMPASQSTNRLTGGFTTNWRPAAWFVTQGTVGVDHGSQHATESLLPQVFPLFPFFQTQLGIGNTTTDLYTVDLRGSATAALTSVIRTVTSVGVQLADTRVQGVTAIATNISATNFTLNGAVNPTVTQLGDRQATLGGYGEEQVAVSDRLFLTAALRVDAGSGFGNAYNTAVYPKASVSWLVLPSGPTTVRLRGAFGESGVQPPNGAALQLYSPSSVWLNGGLTSTVAIANVQDQRLQPERSEEYEGGMDLGLWQSRLSVELTGYSKTTHDALVNTGTGWEGGNLPYAENVGTVRNAGVEAVMTAGIVQRRTLTWDVSLNASVNTNKLVALAPGIPSQQLSDDFARYRFTAGYPLYGYWAPRASYADLNRDGIIEPNEVTVGASPVYAGTSLPSRQASVGTHVALGGGAFSVGALVDYRGGFRLLNAGALTEASYAPQTDRASNDHTAPLWQQARDIAAGAILASGQGGGAAPAGFYEDATFVRFRELSLTYVMPRSLVRVLRARQMSLTGAVRNLGLWTRYTGADPEVANSGGANTQLAPTSNAYIVNNNLREDSSAIPLLRYWVLRLNVGL